MLSVLKRGSWYQRELPSFKFFFFQGLEPELVNAKVRWCGFGWFKDRFVTNSVFQMINFKYYRNK